MDKENITDELLMAFADGELVESERLEIEALVSQHAELAERVEQHKVLAKSLRNFFSASNEKTPEYVAQEILKLTEAEKNDNVIELNIFKKLRDKANISINSLVKLAAVFAIGLYLGPTIFSTTSMYRGPSKTSENLTHLANTPSVSIIQGGREVKPGESLYLGEDFKLRFWSNIDGRLSIFDENGASFNYTDSGKNELEDLIVEADRPLIKSIGRLTEKGIFTIIVKFRSLVSEQTYKISYSAEPKE